MLGWQSCFPSEHSSSSLQTNPLPVYPPDAHEQLKLPGRFVQTALLSHGLRVAHSSTSVQVSPSPVKPVGHEHSKPPLTLMHVLGSWQPLAWTAQWSIATSVPLTNIKSEERVHRPWMRWGRVLSIKHEVHSHSAKPVHAPQLSSQASHTPPPLANVWGGQLSMHSPSSVRMGAAVGQPVQSVGSPALHSAHVLSHSRQISSSSAYRPDWQDGRQLETSRYG
jgi:hypothetical protein